MSDFNVLRAIGDDMALIFGRRPLPTLRCDECNEPTERTPCRECVVEGQAAYRREHGGSMDR